MLETLKVYKSISQKALQSKRCVKLWIWEYAKKQKVYFTRHLHKVYAGEGRLEWKNFERRGKTHCGKVLRSSSARDVAKTIVAETKRGRKGRENNGENNKHLVKSEVQKQSGNITARKNVFGRGEGE